MRTGTTIGAAAALLLLQASSAAPAARGEEAKPVGYAEHVQPILRQHCFKCHGDDKHEADLNFQSYDAFLKGGSGGTVLIAGRPDRSVFFQAVSHTGDASPMPPNRDPIPSEQIAVLRTWIEQGMRKDAGGASLLAARRSLEFKPAAAADAGPGAMPESIPDANLPALKRPLPIVALASSPRAPLLAVAGQERVLLHHAETGKLLATLPFPEGAPYVLQFSRDGSVLMAAGGKPVKQGKAVLFDVKSGKRLAEVGDELDAVLAADLSPDQKLLALGGSGKVVKVYRTTTGELAYKLVKHTDWITALEFSPDGAKLASADRSGGVHLWESESGGFLLNLDEHKDGVNGLDWRSDGRMLATAGEDGRLILWDAQDGWPSKVHAAPHAPPPSPDGRGKAPNGVLSVHFLQDGKLLSCGRDRTVRLWDAGGNEVKRFAPPAPAALTTRVAASADLRTLAAGDDRGALHLWPNPAASQDKK